MTTATVTATATERREFGRIFQRKGSRFLWVRYRVNGKVYEESTHSASRREAEKFLARKQAELGLGVFVAPDAKRVTVGELFMLYLAAAAAKHQDPPKLKRLAEWFEVTVETGDDGAVTYSSGRKAMTVTYGVLQRYVADRQASGAADATIHNELAALRRAFRLGKKAGKVTVPPEFPMPTVQNVRESFFTVAQLDRLLELLPDYLRAAVHFAALTGMRAANVFGLLWTHVDFGRGLVRVPFGRTKTGEPLTVPFAHGSALEELLRAQEWAKQGPFVFHRSGKRIRSYHGAWYTAVKKLGDDAWGEQFDPATGTTKKVLKRFHDLRHTFAQMMTDAGVAPAAILELGCWKTPKMLERYRIVNEEAKRQAVAQRDTHIAAERAKATQVLDFPQTAVDGQPRGTVEGQSAISGGIGR